MRQSPHNAAEEFSMCGIAGLILRQAASADPAVVARLAAALAHRGPDGHGSHIAGNVALTQTRLAIIDLATGDQPLHAGSATLVGNGEVYNYRELTTAGALHCATGSDCEPPLHLWRQQGLAFAESLRGMYALAIHDRSSRQVVLTRDPFGIKPLYVADIPDGIAFASEPQALIAAGLVTASIRPEARNELLQAQFTTGPETIFSGIRRVLPGETLVVADGAIVARRHREALPDGGPEHVTEAEALTRLDTALMQSVDLHQRSDVPYGLFLSGGIDSAAILAAMARLNEQPVLAFTAGFDVPGAPDERAPAAAAAKGAGARHVTLSVSEAEVWRHLPAIVAAMDDPAADYAIIPTWFLARRARQEVKVVLSGEGGDEMFGGYGRYRAAMRPWWLGGKAMRSRGAFDRVDVLRESPAGWRDGIAAAEASAMTPGRTRLQVAQALDVADWLPNDLLLKLDRCLMAHGVEGRTPFLEHGVAAAAFLLPDALKAQAGVGKWLLRRWLETRAAWSRPFASKQGFTVPVGAWIARAADRLAPLVAAQPGVAEVARPDRILPLFRAAGGKHEGLAAWHLLFWALWHQRHIVGRAPEGDVFEMLG